MSGAASEGVVDWVRDRAAEHGWEADRRSFLRELSVADYVSLVALLFGWAAALLMVSGQPNWGLLAMLGAFAFDKLDGAVARVLDISGDLGLQVDSYIDVFAYLVPAALLYHLTMAPNVYASLVVGFVILAFGGLRLIRHSTEGFGVDDGVAFYRGLTVVHANAVVVANYFLVSFVPAWNGWLAAATVLPMGPAMIANYRSYKTDGSHLLVGVLATVAAGLCLILIFGV
jgi:CDP-diacylglycerol--serine O-phosphatidyltransferase